MNDGRDRGEVVGCGNRLFSRKDFVYSDHPAEAWDSIGALRRKILGKINGGQEGTFALIVPWDVTE